MFCQKRHHCGIQKYSNNKIIGKIILKHLIESVLIVRHIYLENMPNVSTVLYGMNEQNFIFVHMFWITLWKIFSFFLNTIYPILLYFDTIVVLFAMV